MNWVKIMGRCLAVGMILSITGCEKSPEVEIKEGVTFASSMTERRGTEAEKVQMADEIVLNAIETEIVSEISSLKINAQINNIPEKAFTGVVKPKLINVEKIYDILYGEVIADSINSNEMDEIETANNETKETAEAVESHSWLEYEQVGTWSLMNENNQTEIAQISIDENGILAYINFELNEKYPNNTSISVTTLGEVDAPNTTLTREEAMSNLINLINKMDGPEIEVLNCLAYQDTNGKGYYELSFVPVFQEIALTNNLPTLSNNPIVTIFGRAIITEEGVMELVGNFMIEYEEIENTEKIITNESIVDVLTTYISTGRINTTSKVQINQIVFEYLPKYIDGKINIIPIWHLYFDEESADDVDTAEFSVRGIGIAANDGELQFAY